ncbi:hypothetical protein R1flu_024664 [Riccia fluitans]|uniref:Uncharacterized protein n=1 Tax=Riccia fluitans TaxID=41844 RepID=A0ABD1XVP4_9MARC
MSTRDQLDSPSGAWLRCSGSARNLGFYSISSAAHQIVLAAQAMSSIETDQSGMTFHKKEVGICNVTIELQLLQLYFDSLQEWPPSPEFQDPA